MCTKKSIKKFESNLFYSNQNEIFKLIVCKYYRNGLDGLLVEIGIMQVPNLMLSAIVVENTLQIRQK